MSADFVGVGPLARAAAATSLVITLPDGWVQNDVGFIQFEQIGGNSAITTPAGWTLASRVQYSSTKVSAVFYRRLQTADPATVTVTVATSTTVLGGCVSAHRGISLVTVLDVIDTTYTAIVGNDPDLVFPGYAADPAPATNIRTGANSRVLAFCTGFINVSSVGGLVFPADFAAQQRKTDGSGSRVETGYALHYGSAANDVALASGWIDESDSRTPGGLIYFGATISGGISSEPCAFHTLPLRCADTFQPPAQTLRALAAQPASYSTGVAMAPAFMVTGGPKLVVQVASPFRQDGTGRGAWAADTADATDSVWGDTWWGAYQWLDISSLVRGVEWSRGSESPGDRPRVGTAAITLDNRNGDASPWATSGIFNVSSRSWLRAGVLVRFGVAVSIYPNPPVSWFPFFTGLIESMPEETSENVDGWVTLNLVETPATLAVDTRTAVTPIGGGEAIDRRLNRILASAIWPYGFDYRRLTAAALAVGLQATTLADDPITETYLASDSAGVRVLAGSDGALTATDAYPAAPSTLYTFANNPGVGDLPIPPGSVQPYASLDRILNSVQGSRVGGTTQTVESQESIGQYGRVAQGNGFPRTDLISTTDASVLAILTAARDRLAFDEMGIESFQVNASMDPAGLFPALTQLASSGLEDRTALEVVWTHPSGDVLTFAAFIDAFSFGITPTAPGQLMSWVGTLTLVAATPRTS